MRDSEQISIVKKFIEAVNEHDVDKMAALMDMDFLFIDSQGEEFKGIEDKCRIWNEYFRYIPDYKITVEEMVESENSIVILGTAEGTYCPGKEILDENRWKIPAAWKAVVAGSKLAYWQVFADNSGVLRIVKRYPGKGFRRQHSIYPRSE